VHTCDILNNAQYAFYASSCSDPGTVIDAENNWWGVADSAAIEARIYHRVDYATSPWVDYVPFAIGPFHCACPDFCDLNRDGALNPADVVIIVNWVYKSIDARQQIPTCTPTNGDWNCDELVNPTDVVFYVNYIYKSLGPGPCDPCAP